METPLFSSPIDKLEMLTTTPLTDEFIELAKTYATYRYDYAAKPKSGYRESYCLGCVTVMFRPAWRTQPWAKICLSPSKAGFSLPQLLKWVGYIVGFHNLNSVRVIRAEHKVDAIGLNYHACAQKVLCTAQFKVSSIRRVKSYLRFAGIKSPRHWRIYDKALELAKKHKMNFPGDWTRLEILRNYKKKEQMTILEFIRHLRTYNPFGDLFMLDADLSVVDGLIQPYGQRIGNVLLEPMRRISKGDRDIVVSQLDSNGQLVSFDSDYARQRDAWLRQAKPVRVRRNV